MTYEEVVTYIHSLPWKSARPTLDRTIELMARLGNPERQTKYVHITGTNGKGSTAAMTASILRKAGYRTGLLTSPDLWKYNERFNVDGADISDEELGAITEEIRGVAAGMAEHPTEYELTAAIGFTYFARKQCDIVVLEVGMGGTLDSTNVIPAPEVAVFTNIGLDHTEILGDTLEAIASVKAGIIKPGCDTVLYPSTEGVRQVIADACDRAGAKLTLADFSAIRDAVSDFSGQSFTYGELENIRLPLLGDHQLCNCAVTIEVIRALRARGWQISDEALCGGIAATVWPGRFELLRRDPVFIVDGGHNPQCLYSLAENVKKYLSGRDITALVGVMADKDYSEMFATMAPLVDRFVAVTPRNKRALPAPELAELITRFGKPAQAAQTVEQGIADAIALAGSDGVVLAFGSLYMTGVIRHTLLMRAEADV